MSECGGVVRILDDGGTKNTALFRGRCRKCLCLFEMERRHLDRVDVEFLQVSATLYGVKEFERGCAKCPQCRGMVSLSKVEADAVKAEPRKGWFARMWEALTRGVSPEN